MADLQRRCSLQMQYQYNERSCSLPPEIAKKREMDRIMLQCFGMLPRFQGQGLGTEVPSGYMNQLAPNSAVERSFAFPNSATTRAPSFNGRSAHQNHSTVINSLNSSTKHAVHSQQLSSGLNGAPSPPTHPFSGNANCPNSPRGHMPNHLHQEHTRLVQLPLEVSPLSARLKNMIEHEGPRTHELLSDMLHLTICGKSGSRKCAHFACLKAKSVLSHIHNCKNASCNCSLTKELLIHFKKCRGQCELCKPVWTCAKNSTKRKMPDPESNAPEVLDFRCKRSKIDSVVKETIKEKSCNDQLGEPTIRISSNEDGEASMILESGRESHLQGNCIEPSVQVMETVRDKSCNNQQCEPTSRILSNEDGDSRMILQESRTESLLEGNCIEPSVQVMEIITEKSSNDQLCEPTSRILSNEDGDSRMILQESRTESLIEGNCIEPSVQVMEIITEKSSNDQESRTESLLEGNCIEPSVQVMEIIKEKPSNDQLCEPTSTSSNKEDSESSMNLQESGAESLTEGNYIEPSVQVMENITEKSSNVQLCEPSSRPLSDENDESGMNLREEGAGSESLPVGNCMVPFVLERNSINNEQEEALSETINSSSSSEDQDKEMMMEMLSVDQLVDRICSEAVDTDVAMQVDADLNETRQRRNCASLINSFTREQIIDHKSDLMQSNKKSGDTSDEDEVMDDFEDGNCCSLCGQAEISFDKPPSFCSVCGYCIRKGGYYTKSIVDSTNDGGYELICKPCHKKCYNSTTPVKFEKMENSATNELWVQCEKCEKWQHQICALFSDKKNQGEQAEYTCANCHLSEIESGNHQSLAKSDFFEAKQLPRTELSDHIEQRLLRRLEEDREKRANYLGKNISEVEGAENLVVRVVSSVTKKVKVMDSLRKEFLKDNNYPEEFPYNSKAILLFQKIGGVDVCLFAAYVQEYGLDCPDPNQRRVYLSYIDSVNYFRPKITAATGDSLRTLVYHEILIGYLDYCSKRGFTHCHLWVYPPRKNDCYILYAHPEEQKMPSPNRLRKWYNALIQKATEENIVGGRTTLYRQYFQQIRQGKISQLPYFEGDYWPKLAVNILKDEKNGSVMKKKIDGKLSPCSAMEMLESYMSKDKDNIIITLRPNEEDISVGQKSYETTKSRHTLRMEVEEEAKMTSKILDTRVDFLNLCEENNYRFDSLRRAKHSTMMIIQHLYNDALNGS